MDLDKFHQSTPTIITALPACNWARERELDHFTVIAGVKFT